MSYTLLFLHLKPL